MKQTARILHDAEDGRVASIDISGKKFTTPTRAVTHAELEKFRELIVKHHAQEQLSSIDAPGCEIQETVLDFNPQGLQALVSRNETLGRRAYNISSRNRNGDYRVKICNIQLRGQQTVIPHRAIRLLTMMQIQSESLDMITLPDPSYIRRDEKELKKAYKIARKTLNTHGLDNMKILPHLDLKTQPENLASRIDLLLDIGCEAIAFRHRTGAIASMERVAETLSKKDVWLHLSGVPKKLSASPMVAWMHVLPMFSFDSMSSYKYPPGPRSLSSSDGKLPTIPDRPDPGGGRGGSGAYGKPTGLVEIHEAVDPFAKQLRFDSDALGFLNRDEHRTILGDALSCTCFLCRRHDLDGFYNAYGFQDGKSASKKLKDHQDVHELYDSHAELQSSQIQIKEGSYREYLREKPAIQRFPKVIPEPIRQTRLDQFS